MEFQLEPHHRNVSDEELFNNLVKVWTALGRQPKYNDLTTDVSRYCSGTYEKRFHGWRKALEAFVRWANEGIQPEYCKSEKTGAKNRTPRNINWRLRALVLMRDGGQCKMCGATPTRDGVKLHVSY